MLVKIKLVKIKYLGPPTGGSAPSNLTVNKTYTAIAFDNLVKGSFGSSTFGTAFALIVDDTGTLYVTSNIFDRTNTEDLWDFVSATYEDCSTVNA